MKFNAGDDSIGCKAHWNQISPILHQTPSLTSTLRSRKIHEAIGTVRHPFYLDWRLTRGGGGQASRGDFDHELTPTAFVYRICLPPPDQMHNMKGKGISRAHLGWRAPRLLHPLLGHPGSQQNGMSFLQGRCRGWPACSMQFCNAFAVAF